MCFGKFFADCLIGCRISCLGILKSSGQICNALVNGCGICLVVDCVLEIGLCLVKVFFKGCDCLVDSLVCLFDEVKSALSLCICESVEQVVDISNGVCNRIKLTVLGEELVKLFDRLFHFCVHNCVAADGNVACDIIVFIQEGVVVEVSVHHIGIVLIKADQIAVDRLKCANTNIDHLSADIKIEITVNTITCRLDRKGAIINVNICFIFAINTHISGNNRDLGAHKVKRSILKRECGFGYHNVQFDLININGRAKQIITLCIDVDFTCFAGCARGRIQGQNHAQLRCKHNSRTIKIKTCVLGGNVEDRARKEDLGIIIDANAVIARLNIENAVYDTERVFSLGVDINRNAMVVCRKIEGGIFPLNVATVCIDCVIHRNNGYGSICSKEIGIAERKTIVACSNENSTCGGEDNTAVTDVNAVIPGVNCKGGICNGKDAVLNLNAILLCVNGNGSAVLNSKGCIEPENTNLGIDGQRTLANNYKLAAHSTNTCAIDQSVRIECVIIFIGVCGDGVLTFQLHDVHIVLKSNNGCCTNILKAEV